MAKALPEVLGGEILPPLLILLLLLLIHTARAVAAACLWNRARRQSRTAAWVRPPASICVSVCLHGEIGTPASGWVGVNSHRRAESAPHVVRRLKGSSHDRNRLNDPNDSDRADIRDHPTTRVVFIDIPHTILSSDASNLTTLYAQLTLTTHYPDKGRKGAGSSFSRH